MSFKETKIYKWFDNFWYHYKWIAIVVSIFAVFIIVSTVQMATKEDGDIYVMYAGPAVINEAFPASVPEFIPNCWKKDATASTVPQTVPPKSSLLFTSIIFFFEKRVRPVLNNLSKMIITGIRKAAAIKLRAMPSVSGESAPGVF